MRQGRLKDQIGGAIRDEAIARLRSMGIDVDQFVWPAANDFGDFPSQERPVAAE
jgi:hypothetical protein